MTPGSSNTDLDARAILAALQTAEGNDVSRADLAQKTGLTPEQVQVAADWLLLTGLAHPEEPRRGADPPKPVPDPPIFIARETSQLLDRLHAEQAVSADERSLDVLLPTLPYPELEEAAGLWGARVVPALHARAARFWRWCRSRSPSRSAWTAWCSGCPARRARCGRNCAPPAAAPRSITCCPLPTSLARSAAASCANSPRRSSSGTPGRSTRPPAAPSATPPAVSSAGC